MIAVDTNVLVYAHRPEFPLHRAAKSLMHERMVGRDPWMIPLHCLVEFAGVVSHPGRFVQPSSPEQIRAQISAWVNAPSHALYSEGAEMLEGFQDLLELGKVGGARVHDARIAAACVAAGVRELLSSDRDYGRFPQLKVRNPFV